MYTTNVQIKKNKRIDAHIRSSYNEHYNIKTYNKYIFYPPFQGRAILITKL